jgi:Domain of unknown function (DUF4331)
LILTNSSIPYLDNSLPKPLFLTPPNGTLGSEATILFTDYEDTFNRIDPTRDQELFTKKFADILESFGYSPENAQQVALTLLPDILDYDYSSPEGYRNGRKLTDDIIDIQLALLTNGRVTTDKVGPHQDLLATFPYLGSPHPTS